jgi:hypothetical protein
VSAGCGAWAGQWENWGNEKKQDESVASSAKPGSFVYEAIPLTPGQPFSGLPGQTVEVAGRQWVAAYGNTPVPDHFLKPVGSAGSAAVSALSWDEPPYDQLYIKTTQPGQYIVLQ